MIESFFRTTLALVARALGVPEPKLEITVDVPNLRSMDGTIFINPQFAQRQFTYYCSEETCNRAIASAMVAHELAHLMLDDDATPFARYVYPEGQLTDAETITHLSDGDDPLGYGMTLTFYRPAGGGAIFTPYYAAAAIGL